MVNKTEHDALCSFTRTVTTVAFEEQGGGYLFAEQHTETLNIDADVVLPIQGVALFVVEIGWKDNITHK